MFRYVVAGFAQNAIESIVDNELRNGVAEPALGSVVYCDLAFGFAEHSGIYVGNGEIIHLTRHGIIERCTPDEFIDGTTARSIYVSCRDERPVGSAAAAERARNFAKKDYWRDYNVLLENCHMFTDLCVTGEKSSSTFLTLLKDSCARNMGINTWRVWKRSASAAPGAPIDVSHAALEGLKAELRKQGSICKEHRTLVNRRCDEYNKHCDDNPAFSTFGGLFYESKAKSWSEKHDRLLRELDNLERIMDDEDRKWDRLSQAIDDMERQLKAS